MMGHHARSEALFFHFPGLEGLDKPIVWVFPKFLDCLDCGFMEFAIPETELRLLAEGDSTAACLPRRLDAFIRVGGALTYPRFRQRLRPLIPQLTKSSPPRTPVTAGKSSLPASVFRTYPCAPALKAARTISSSLF